MNRRGLNRELSFIGAVILFSAFFVLQFLTSCSPSSPVLCTVRLGYDDEARSISAVFDPLDDYTVYYRSIYRGSDIKNSYGDMSQNQTFNRLTSNGIILSQGLWEIEAIFKESNVGDTYTPSEGEPIASSGDIFINLNTKSINVRFPSGSGYMKISSYNLVNLPSTILNTSVTVSVYKYETSSSSFTSSSTPITLSERDTGKTYYLDRIMMDSGAYYAVLEVKGSESGTERILFTDCIGFVVRDGLTTDISGYCNKYNGSSSGGSFIVKDPDPSGTGSTNIDDIKEFKGEQFSNDGTYVITDGDYSIVPTENKTNETFEKVLNNGQDISINMNGNSIINSDGTNKASFTIGSGAELTIINDDEKNSKDAEVIGFKGTPSDADKNPNFSVNGGTLTLGSTDPSVEGSIDLKGAPPSLSSSGTKHAAIVLTSKGGTVNLLSPGNGSYVNVEETTIGISTAFNETNKSSGTDMNININMENASIHVKGDSNDYSTGIRLDGTKSGTENYKGTINISIKGVGSDGHSIQTSNSNGSKASIEQSCIYIMNYAGTINLSFDENAHLLSKYGYAVALVNCTGKVTIVNKGTALGSITYSGEQKEKKGNAIYLENCRDVTIYNSGTLSSDKKQGYSVHSVKSNVTVDTTNDGKSVEIYTSNQSLYKR